MILFGVVISDKDPRSREVHLDCHFTIVICSSCSSWEGSYVNGKRTNLDTARVSDVFGSVASVVCVAMVILVWYSFTAVNPGMSIRLCAQECWHHPREGAVVESGEEP